VSHRFYTESLFQQGNNKIFLPIESFPCAKSGGVVNPDGMMSIYTFHWRLNHVMKDSLTKWIQWTIETIRNNF